MQAGATTPSSRTAAVDVVRVVTISDGLAEFDGGLGVEGRCPAAAVGLGRDGAGVTALAEELADELGADGEAVGRLNLSVLLVDGVDDPLAEVERDRFRGGGSRVGSTRRAESTATVKEKPI